MTTNHRIQTGQLGENIACIYLQKKSYKIATRNFRCKSGEIDIVATRANGTTSFVEVKCRVGDRHGSPHEAVTPDKLRRLYSAIRLYIKANHLVESKFSIEVVSIVLKPDLSIESLRHFDDLGQYLE